MQRDEEMEEPAVYLSLRGRPVLITGDDLGVGAQPAGSWATKSVNVPPTPMPSSCCMMPSASRLLPLAPLGA